ncbi:MAG: RsmB/NOP family class I SAM-dependent RNA methyltransferase [Armatimonadota bacterium]|nr:RsmB/NOP family class I SAM-dependent RNA methyltransferase [Armatimonadota bacterium]MDR7561742.1 RsmB/NOP family class I SAM-dependent RNA methyltransferase [Armatimonadota bacterium]
MLWERYRPIIDNWEAFWAAAGRPQPRTIRVQTTRITPAALAARLEARGFRLHPVEGLPAVLRVDSEPCPISKTVEHWLGLFYIQEAVMALPALAVARDRPALVADLCAAPGGKTTHLADLLPEATVAAVDLSEARVRALVANVQRLGCLNVLMAQADARRMPPEAVCDAALVDAPCTAEGNLRDDPRVHRDPGRAARMRLASRQAALLRRALAVVRPGGLVVYATCTFAPEENEAVVDRILREVPDLEVESLDLPVPHASGVTAFGDAVFDARLRHAVRVYPHHLDSGGLFVVALRKGKDSGAPPAPPPRVFPGTPLDPQEAQRRVERAVAALCDQFQVDPAVLADQEFLVASRTIWMHRCRAWPAALARPRWPGRLVGCGLRAFAAWGRDGYRPTSWLAQHLGDRIRSRRLALDPAGWIRLLAGQGMRVDASDGLVALALDDAVLGVGHVRGGRLTHLLAADRAAQLREALELTARG